MSIDPGLIALAIIAITALIWIEIDNKKYNKENKK